MLQQASIALGSGERLFRCVFLCGWGYEIVLEHTDERLVCAMQQAVRQKRVDVDRLGCFVGDGAAQSWWRRGQLC